MSLLDRVYRSALWPMLWKEFRQMRRDRFTLGMLLGIPAMELLLFGYAIRTEVRHLPMVVLDQAKTRESRALVSVMVNTQNFDLAGQVTGRAELDDQLASGHAKAALVIPPDFTREYKRGHTASAQVVVDAVDPLASSAAIAGAALASRAGAAALARDGRAPDPVLDVRVRPRYNPALESALNIVPGLVAMLLTITMVAITSMSVVRERERGTLEQLIVTPISTTSVIVGKILPFVLVGYVQMTVILALGHFVFRVPMRGSLIELYLLTFAFIIAILGVGLLISSNVKTQAQAMQLSMFYMLPNILLSGFMFPREAMPPVARAIGGLLPMTYYLMVVRGIVLKGLGVQYLWKPVLVLTGFAAVLVVLSVRRFAKTLE